MPLCAGSGELLSSREVSGATAHSPGVLLRATGEGVSGQEPSRRDDRRYRNRSLVVQPLHNASTSRRRQRLLRCGEPPPHGEDDHPGDQTLEPSDVEPRIDVDRAFATFHPDLQEQQNLEEFEIRATEHAGSLARRTVGNWITSVENDTATVEGCFTGEGGVEVGSCLFWLSRENDTWKIVAFRIEDELGSFVGGTIPGSEG